jgi:hypothetical protein
MKLKTMHAANHSHVTSDGLVTLSMVEVKPLAFAVAHRFATTGLLDSSTGPSPKVMSRVK